MTEFLSFALFHRISRCLFVVGIVGFTALFSGCGGGSSSATNVAPNSAPASSLSTLSSTEASSLNTNSSAVLSSSAELSSASSISSTVSSASSGLVVISGQVTYDFVPHDVSNNGLDYAATATMPGRGLVVELLDTNNNILSSGITTANGDYSFTVTRDLPVRVRVKAQLLSPQINSQASWNFKVTDNTSNNDLYTMSGSLLIAAPSTAVRNLHAASGWTGNAYTQPRVAAPFAILDSIYTGLERLLGADNSVQLPALELRWSPNNITADGELDLGEIGTSFYRDDLNAIYLLGGQDEDTDEYDRHVILHEWGHYIEAKLSRSDNIGGNHQGDDKLDMRVAMSEGFANAFSAMLLDDPVYRDASGEAQASGFQITVNRINNAVRGWYSEASIQSVLYNFYTSDNNKTARNFSDVFTIIRRENYRSSDAFVSVYLFAEQLRLAMPAVSAGFDSLLTGQNIAITDRFGSGESNSGGAIANLPVYKNLPLNNTSVNVCSSNENGSYNKLGVSQFLLLNIVSSGRYEINATAAPLGASVSDPDLYLYRQGQLIAQAESAAADDETINRFLSAGVYVLEVVEARALDSDVTASVEQCFNVRALPN